MKTTGVSIFPNFRLLDFLGHPTPSSSFEADIPEEDPAADMFSWSPPPSP